MKKLSKDEKRILKEDIQGLQYLIKSASGEDIKFSLLQKDVNYNVQYEHKQSNHFKEFLRSIPENIQNDLTDTLMTNVDKIESAVLIIW